MNTMVEALQYRVCVYLILLHMPGKIHLYLEVVICAQPGANVTTHHFASHNSPNLISTARAQHIITWLSVYMAYTQN